MRSKIASVSIIVIVALLMGGVANSSLAGKTEHSTRSNLASLTPPDFQNLDFESETIWSLYGDASWEHSVTHSGSGAAKILLRTGGGQFEQAYVPCSIPAGYRASVNAWVKMPVAGSDDNKVFAMNITGYDQSKAHITFTSNAGVWPGLNHRYGPYPDWTNVSWESSCVEASYETKFVTLTFHTRDATGNYSGYDRPVYIDDVEVTYTSPIPITYTPFITSVTPPSGVQGNASCRIDIVGVNTNFSNKSQVIFSGTGISNVITWPVNKTHVGAGFAISPDATPGPRDVNVITDGEVPIPLAGGFTVVATKTDYKPGRDGYGFENKSLAPTTDGYFLDRFIETFTQEQIEQNYESAMKYFDTKYLPDMQETAQCDGMVATSSRFHRGFDAGVLSECNKENPSRNYVNPSDFEDADVQDPSYKGHLFPPKRIVKHLVKFQGYQGGSEFMQWKADQMSKTTNDVLAEIESQLDKGNEVSVGITYSTGQHALCAYHYEVVSAQEHRVYVYDPNSPGPNLALYITFDTTYSTLLGNKGQWKYGDHEGTNGILSYPILCFPVSLWDSRPTGTWASGSTSVMPVASEGAHLLATDAQGRNTGWSDGKYLSEIPGSFRIQNVGSSAPTTESYRLPLGSYTLDIKSQSTTCSGTAFGYKLTASLKDSSLPRGEDYLMGYSAKGAWVKTGFKGKDVLDEFELSFPGGKSGRVCKLSDLSLSGGEKLGCELYGGGVKVSNNGEKKDLDLTLAQYHGSSRSDFYIGGLPIDKGESLTFEPQDWNKLETTRVKITSSKGRERYVDQGSCSYYFAEGCTRGGFEEYLCIQNPSADQTASVAVTYNFGADQGAPLQKTYTVGPHSRSTVSVNQEVGPEKDVSIALDSNLPVVAERPMYFNYQGKWTGGHDVVGALSTAKEYYFAEGCTRGGFEEWLCLQNPGGEDAKATITYMLETGKNRTESVNVAAHSRYTHSVNNAVGPDQDVSIKVTCDKPIVAERPMYFNYHGTWDGGHDVVGATSPSTDFYFAEGCTRAGFEEWLCLQNPQSTQANITITYMLGTGQTVKKTLKAGPRSRQTVSVNEAVGPDRDVSCSLTSDVPVICERPMYFNYQGKWTGGHDVVGCKGSRSTFFFAEGCTREGFDEWISLQNPGRSNIKVKITYMLGTGENKTRDITVPPHSRQTVNVVEDLGRGQDVSCAITSDRPVICERPMYFNYQGKWTGGHDVVGYTVPE